MANHFTPEELAEELGMETGEIIRLGDIATVERHVRTPEAELAIIDDEQAVVVAAVLALFVMVGLAAQRSVPQPQRPSIAGKYAVTSRPGSTPAEHFRSSVVFSLQVIASDSGLKTENSLGDRLMVGRLPLKQ